MGLKRIRSTTGSSFSDAVQIEGAGRWIFISGQVGTDDSGTISTAGFPFEADRCFERIRLALERCSATMSDVVKINAFLTDLDLYAEYNEARRRAFGDALPASATVKVAGLLLGARVEVDAIAFVADEQRK